MILRNISRAVLRSALPRLSSRNSALPAVMGPRLMSSGHGEVDIMDKKLYPPGLHPASYDEHIIPSGSWEKNNAELQTKYNRQLVIGVVFFVATVYYMTICPEIDMVMAPKSIGVNPPNFTVLPPKDA